MAYTIGASHGPFTGTGSFVIAKPAGIRTIVTNIPSWTGHENTSPLRYHRLGRFTLGNSHGFSESQLLEYAQQLVYPIPAIWELLAYDINDGASCTFYELVEATSVIGAMPWDRAPTQVGSAVNLGLAGGAAGATMLTYTVPSGRKLYLSHLTVRCKRQTAASTVAGPYGWAAINGVARWYSTMWSNTVGAESSAGLAAGPLVLLAGGTVELFAANPDTGGSCAFHHDWGGFLFDA